MNNFSIAIVAQVVPVENFIDSGMVIAFGAGAACVMLWLFGKKILRGATVASPALDAADSNTVQLTNLTLEPHLLPVLIAAATAVLGCPVVVHRITFLNQDTVSGWAEAGRMSLHLSHNFRRDPQ